LATIGTFASPHGERLIADSSTPLLKGLANWIKMPPESVAGISCVFSSRGHYARFVIIQYGSTFGHVSGPVEKQSHADAIWRTPLGRSRRDQVEGAVTKIE